MKVLFLLDNAEFVEVAPEKLQIRQLSDGLAALGTEVTIPVKDDKGEVKLDADGKPETQLGFRPFINYNVTLSVPKPAEATPAVVTPVEAVKLPAVKKTGANGKAKSNRKAN
jgi:hypothetical protein